MLGKTAVTVKMLRNQDESISLMKRWVKKCKKVLAFYEKLCYDYKAVT